MKEHDFKQLVRILDKRAKLRPLQSRRACVENAVRARAGQMRSMEAYLDHLAARDTDLEREVDLLLALVEPMAGDFFTNPDQFDYLAAEILPARIEEKSGVAELSAWVAGCSSGEEAYALGFVLSDFMEDRQEASYSLLGTDSSERLLEQAVGAVYPEEKVLPVPHRMRKKYLLRSRDRSRRLVRVSREVRDNVSFKRLALSDDLRWLPLMDVIFCRESALPFNGAGLGRLVKRLTNRLADGGHLFLGREHALAGLESHIKQVAPAIYKKV